MSIEKDTGETPTALKNRPFPTRWSVGYWKAFQELSGSRTWTTAGPTEIIYIAKIVWLDENEILDLDERGYYLSAVQQLDIEFLKQFDSK